MFAVFTDRLGVPVLQALPALHPAQNLPYISAASQMGQEGLSSVPQMWGGGVLMGTLYTCYGTARNCSDIGVK